MTQEIEALVRKGEFVEARRRIRAIHLKKVPRRDALAYANLARRLDLTKLSLKILNPIVRPENRRGSSPATPEERIEYAASLRNLGAVPEAEEILGEIDAGKYPQAEFHLALCLIAGWQ